MKSLELLATLLACISLASTDPTRVLQKRDAQSDPPGSVLSTPAELPSYSPTASISPPSFNGKFQWQIYKSCLPENREAIVQA